MFSSHSKTDPMNRGPKKPVRKHTRTRQTHGPFTDLARVTSPNAPMLRLHVPSGRRIVLLSKQRSLVLQQRAGWGVFEAVPNPWTVPRISPAVFWCWGFCYVGLLVIPVWLELEQQQGHKAFVEEPLQPSTDEWKECEDRLEDMLIPLGRCWKHQRKYTHTCIDPTISSISMYVFDNYCKSNSI